VIAIQNFVQTSQHIQLDQSNITNGSSKNKSNILELSKVKRTHSDFATVVVLAEERLSLIIGNKVKEIFFK